MQFLHRVAARVCAAALGVLITFTPVAATAASANDYTAKVANSLRSNPVYVDPNASPSITADQANQLTSQIRATGKPIYLVLVDNTQTKKFSGPKEFLKQVHSDLGSSGSHVISVSTSKGFYANGYNLPKAIADQAGPLTGPAMKNGGKNPYQVYSYWIDAVAKIKVPSVTTTKPATHPAQSSKSGSAGKVLLIILTVFIGITLLVLLAVVLVNARSRKKNEETETGRLERKADSISNSLMALEPELGAHPEASTAQMNGLEAVQSARTALGSGDTEDAKSYLSTAQKHLNTATALINGQPLRSAVQDRLPDDDTDDYYPQSPTPSMATSTVRVQRPGGRSVTINQNNYSQYQAPGYNHYYQGGMYGGQYWAPGYYSDPFWNYLLLSEALDHHHGDYERGYEAGRRDDGSSYSTEGTAAGTDWGTTSYDNSQAEVIEEGQASGTDWGSSDSDSQSDNSWSSGNDSNNNGWGGSDDSSSNSWSSDNSSSDSSWSSDAGSGSGSDPSSGGDSGGW